MGTEKCPICGGQSFGEFAGRPRAKCLSCHSLERGRVVHLTLQKLGLPRKEDKILHFALEICFINLFTSTHEENYQPCDLFPDIYKNSKKEVKRIDICEDLYSMPSSSWDLIIHNHVLEHLLCSVRGVLRGFDRILKPGGTMIFTIPIHRGKETIEDLNPGLSELERRKRFGQKDHVRLFGDDVTDLIAESLGKDCFIPVSTLFTEEEFLLHAIPWEPSKEPHGHSIFVYRKT